MTNDIASNLFTMVKAFNGGGSIHIMAGVDKNKPDYKTILAL